MNGAYPSDQGLYRREYEHDNCGIGFVANIKGRKSHDIVARGLEVLKRMEHRGAESADNKTGDGAGILTQLPDAFFRAEIAGLPAEGAYGAGLVFLPQKDDEQKLCISILETTIAEEGLSVVAWRNVPVVTDAIGDIARSAEPRIRQIFVGAAAGMNPTQLERRLYIVRKLAERRVRESGIEQKKSFHMPSLSSRTIVYKGMLMPDQVDAYFCDLLDERFASAIALVHSRFSTNTFPSWDLAQPFRMVAHNGEINTIKGNRFWMQARESAFVSELFGDEISKILPVIEPDKSDSASFDNALEMLVATGRPLPHVLMRMVPESWNDKNPIPDDLKYFYEFHSTFMEPWDGPASMVFCDGRYVGGTLDRNGLRPSRYVITHDDLIVMGSEVGVQTFEPEQVKAKGRLMPGKLLLVDTLEGRIIPDDEIKKQIAYCKPYNEWVQAHRVVLEDIPVPSTLPPVPAGSELLAVQQQCGYTREDIDEIIKPMIETGQEPTSSMGTDTPLAVFSERPQPLFNYFKQCFAQVTTRRLTRFVKNW
jgi:glutamate synthase (NADPH/NADH) large chain